MIKRFRQLESEFEGLDPGLLDEVIGYDDAEDPDLPFDSSAFAGAPSSVRRPPSPPPGGGALAGTLPAPSRTRFASFGGDEPVMSFDLEDEPQPDAEPVMSFDLDEAEQAEPVMSFGLDEAEAEPRMFSADEVFAADAVPASPLFTADEVFGGPSPFADDVAEAAAVPGASRPVLSPTAEDQDETDGDPTASAAQVQRGPRPRTMGVDDAFDPMAQTQAERAAIARGERQDRRRRIAGGVLSGLGLLMAAGGGRGSGLGAALAASGGMLNRSANREDRARADMQARLASERERMAQDRQMARDEADAERQAAELELRRALTGSTIAQNEARARSLEEQTLADRAERAAAVGDAAGLRDVIRARVAAMPQGETRAAWERRLAAGGGLDSVTNVDALLNVLAEVGDTDIRRGGRGPGGSGGGGGGEVVRLADGSYGMAPARRASRSPTADLVAAQGGSPEEIAAAEAQDAAAAAGTPAPAAAPRARRARPAAATPAASNAGAPAAPQTVGDDPAAFGNRIRNELIRQGVPPDQATARTDNLVTQYNNRRTRAAAMTEANRIMAAGSRQQVAEAEPERTERARWAERVAPLQRVNEVLRNDIQFMRAHRGEIRAALLAGDTTGIMLSPVQRRIRAIVLGQLSAKIHELAGAAVSTQELERITNLMQTNPAAVAANPDGVIRAIDDTLRSNVQLTRQVRSTFLPEHQAWFDQNMRGVNQ